MADENLETKTERRTETWLVVNGYRVSRLSWPSPEHLRKVFRDTCKNYPLAVVSLVEERYVVEKVTLLLMIHRPGKDPAPV